MNTKLINSIISEINFVKYKINYFNDNGFNTFSLVANDDITSLYRNMLDNNFNNFENISIQYFDGQT